MKNVIQWLEPNNGRSPVTRPVVSLWRDGRLGLNPAAKQLLGPAVRIGLDPAQNRIYLAPANGDTPGGFIVRSYKGGRCGYISATTLIARVDPVAPYRGELHRDGDGLYYIQLPPPRPRPGRE